MIKIDPLKHFKESDNQSWCPIPWITCSTTTNGHYRLCVQANSDLKTRGLFYDKDGNPFNAKDHRISDSRNAELAKDVRKKMLNGEQHSACVRCYQEENNGLTSRRALARFNHFVHDQTLTIDQCQKDTSDNGSINPDDFDIKELDLRMGNRCNLKCRSCYPGESSGWYKEWYETKSTGFRTGDQRVQLQETKSGNIIASDKGLDWVIDSKLLHHLHDDAPFFESLHVVGGEPLLISDHFKALQKFVDSGQSKNITLDYNSNFTVLPTKLLMLWLEFKHVKIGYSIDGVGPVNDYIRHPSKWEDIEKNLRVIDQTNINFDIWPTVTVMAYNVLYIPEIIQWQIEAGYRKQNLIEMILFMVTHPLRNPENMNCQLLPPGVKRRVEEKYLDFKNGWFDNYISKNLEPDLQVIWKNRIEYIFTTIINFMNEEDKSHLLPEFLSRTQKMDEYRSEKFSEALPELYAELLPYIQKLKLEYTL